MVTDLINSDKTVYVVFDSSMDKSMSGGADFMSPTSDNEIMVRINAKYATGKYGGYLDARITLVHELTHAEQAINDPSGFRNRSYYNVYSLEYQAYDRGARFAAELQGTILPNLVMCQDIFWKNSDSIQTPLYITVLFTWLREQVQTDLVHRVMILINSTKPMETDERRNSMKRTSLLLLFFVMTVFVWKAAAADTREIDALIIQLTDKEDTVVHNASLSLAKIGAPAVAALVSALQEADRQLSLTIVDILERMGPQAEESVPALIEVLKQENFSFHTHPLFLNRRAEVSDALISIGVAAVPKLIEVLNDTDKEVVYYAVWVLLNLGAEAQDAVPALCQILDDESERIREIVVSALNMIAAPIDLTVLGELKYMQQGQSVVSATPKRSNPAHAAVPYLIRRLNDESSQVRIKAAGALGNIGDPTAVPALIDALQDKAEDVRGAAASALGDIGAPAKAAVPIMIKMLKNQNYLTRSAILSGLGGIGDPTATPALIDALDDYSAHVRRTAIVQLGRIRDPVETIVPALMKTLADSEAEVRLWGSLALSVIGEPAIPALIEGLNDETVVVRRGTTHALIVMGAAAQAAVLALRKALKDNDKQVRLNAARALKEITPSEAPNTVNEGDSGKKVQIQVIK